MITRPDPPRNFVENLSQRTANSFEFSWQLGESDGGSPVIDFRIYMNADGGEYELIRSGVTDMLFFIDT